MKGLNKRVDDLEKRGGGFAGGVWIRTEAGETADEGQARYEAENGPIPPNVMPIIWTVYTGKEASPCG